MSQILVDQIDPHPNNPRRDLGDLTELADSIRAHGVLQPLVVVPHDHRYRVVIGHRRLAAASMAGLTEVPTVEQLLTEREQVQLMLVENVQRDDLTAIEEAAGYQQLLDMGLKVTMIAKQTGRARKTIDARLQLLGLPDVAQERVHARQLSLEDAAAMHEFADDPDAVAALLKYAGTSNWAWALRQQRDARQIAKDLKPLVDKLLALGFEQHTVVDRHLYQHVKTVESVDDIGDADEYPADVVFEPFSWRAAVNLYEPRPDVIAADDPDAAEKEAAREAAAEEAVRKAEALHAEAKQAIALRDEFVQSVLERKLTALDRAAIVASTAAAVLEENLGNLWELDNWLDTRDDKRPTSEIWRDRFPKSTPEHVLLAMIHASARSSYGWGHAHTDSGMVAVYQLLEQLGYEISDVERARVFPEDAA